MTNVEKLQRAYSEWRASQGRSVATWLALLDDDVRLRSLAEGAADMEFSRGRSGRAEAEFYFSEMARDWEMLDYEAEEFISQGDRVVMVGHCAWRNRRTGKEVESPIVHLWRFRDGKATEYFEFYDTAKALQATRSD